MSAYLSTHRAVTAHTSTERRQGNRRRPTQYPSAFVAQVLTTHTRAAGPAQELITPRNPALDAYRAGGRVTERRMPAGYGWTEDA